MATNINVILLYQSHDRCFHNPSKKIYGEYSEIWDEAEMEYDKRVEECKKIN